MLEAVDQTQLGESGKRLKNEDAVLATPIKG